MLMLDVGGYATELIEHGWFGWEDYDLWLTLDSKVKIMRQDDLKCCRAAERAWTTVSRQRCIMAAD